MDQDGNRVLSADELRSALLTNGNTQLLPNTVKYLMSTVHQVSNDVISFEEFEPLWNDMNQWIQIFDLFDHDRDGRINTTTLGRALAYYGLHISRDVLDMVMVKCGDALPRNWQPGFGGVPTPQMDLDHFVCGCVMVREICKLYETCRAESRPLISRDAFLIAVLVLP
ncbi:hypothetical protein DFH94DRAFT_16707 [Russula ochroleuca]|uniref:EF-hand domain-containing protein n=1 Tax=Russula ochroleuca TaxID=152965 RepID=A0A9P5TEP8_9AGAM|nr:hypothetical protein DFH94DRAFT_16707 [Russula ochroleuca]